MPSYIRTRPVTDTMSLLSTGTHVDESEEPKAEDITEGSRNYEIEAHLLRECHAI